MDEETGVSYPFLPFEQHYVPSARNGKGGAVRCHDKCVVCAYTNPHMDKFKDLDLSHVEVIKNLAECDARIYFAVSGWIEEWFHLVEEQRKDGDGTFHKRVRCKGRGCDMCAEGGMKVFGNRFFNAFSKKAWNEAIFGKNEEIERSCKCGGDIYIPHYVCRKCEEMVVDVCNQCDCGSEEIALDLDSGVAECQACQLTWNIYNAEAIQEQINDELECPHCKHVDVPEPHYVCTEDECDAKPYDIFDAQLVVRKASGEKTAEMVCDGAKVQEADERLFLPKYQGDDEWAQKVADSFKKAIDLSETYPIQTPAEQCQLLGVRNPFSNTGRTKSFDSYEGNDATEEEASE